MITIWDAMSSVRIFEQRAYRAIFSGFESGAFIPKAFSELIMSGKGADKEPSRTKFLQTEYDGVERVARHGFIASGAHLRSTCDSLVSHCP